MRKALFFDVASGRVLDEERANCGSSWSVEGKLDSCQVTGKRQKMKDRAAERDIILIVVWYNMSVHEA